MCQEAILQWFGKIINIQFGTLFIDLIDGILVGKLLNSFNSKKFPLFKEECQEQQFIFNFARINQIYQNMLTYQSNLQPLVPLKIVEGQDEIELNKFVFNIIKIIIEWDKANIALSTLRNDQIQYINQFIHKEEDDFKCQQMFKQLVEYESINAQLEQQIYQLNQENQELKNKIYTLQLDNDKLKQEINQKQKQLDQLELDGIGKGYQMTAEYFKQENQNLQIIVTNLEKRNELQRQQIEILIKFEQKCQDLENEISNFYQQKEQYNSILDNQNFIKDIKKDNWLDQKENLILQNNQAIQIENYEKEIASLKQQIQQYQMNQDLLQEQKQQKETPRKKLLETPRPPKNKMNCLSDQKHYKANTNEEKLQKQISLLKQVIDMFGIQQQKETFSGQRILRGKSLNN